MGEAGGGGQQPHRRTASLGGGSAREGLASGAGDVPRDAGGWAAARPGGRFQVAEAGEAEASLAGPSAAASSVRGGGGFPPPAAERRALVDRGLNPRRGEVGLAAFAFLFSELVQYSQTQVESVEAFEARLCAAGRRVGVSAAELVAHRDRGGKRETRIVGALTFVHTYMWRSLFGRAADALEKGVENDDEYLIHVNDPPLTNAYASKPKDLGSFNPAAFCAGVIQGALEATGFPCAVSAHAVQHVVPPSAVASALGYAKSEPDVRERTTFLIKFERSVIERDARIAAGR